MIRAAIFDVDGTLLDSMGIWEDAGARYLKGRGIEPEAGLGEILYPMTLEEGAAYLKNQYGLEGEIPEIVEGVLETVKHFYYKEVKLKAGVKELLERMSRKGIPMVIATSSSRDHVEAAFQRLGIDSCFQRIFTCSEVGVGKNSPLIYQRAARYLQMRAEEICVFEDVLYAIETAKNAGFYTVGVYDRFSEDEQEQIKCKADRYLRNLAEFHCQVYDGDITDVFRKEWKGTVNMKTALTIAGSDCSGGAGIQADIKTMISNGVYAMSAVTALTAQNTTGVTGIMEVTPEFLGEQLDDIFTDIYPDAVKIGMVSSGALIRKIAEKLRQYQAENIVVDPVMVATSGSKLISDEAIETLKEHLLPMAALLTPNIPEAEVLSGLEIRTEEDMVTAAKEISRTYHCAVLLKGGHQLNDANDLLCRGEECQWFRGEKIDNPNTHGTGCTLSSAIASNLAKGFSLEQSVERAKQYISGALAAMLDLGTGSGPMDHGFDIQSRFAK